MANEIIHTTGCLTDRQIVRLFKKIEETFGGEYVEYQYGPIRVDTKEIEQLLPKGKSHSISYANIRTVERTFNVWVRRGLTGKDRNGSPHAAIREPSPYFDEIHILPSAGNANERTPTVEEIKKLESLITPLLLPSFVASDLNTKTSAVDILSLEISKLADLHTEMIEGVNNQRLALEQERDQFRKDAEKQAEEAKAEIDDYSSMERQRIAELEEQIKAKQKAIDDRNHMHVRRQLRESITKDIEKRVADALLPPTTQKLNLVISVVSGVVAMLAGVFAYSSFAGFNSLLSTSTASSNGAPIPNLDYLLFTELARGGISSAACIGFLIYTISWLRKTYISEVKAAQDLQKYALDINRASWVIETIMEMTTKEGRVLPEKWIEGACHGLFQSSEEHQAEVTPMEAWTALLSGAARVHHGPDGTSLELGRKETKKLVQQGSKRSMQKE